MRKLGAALVLLMLATACDKDKPKPDEAKKSEPVPVPSDMVFNDFLPTTGTGGSGLGVRDSGSEGGLGAVGTGGEPSDPGAAGGAGAPAEGGDKLKVTDPGAEPKAVRKYAFTQGRVDKRIVTIAQSISQTAQGQTQPGQEVTLKISLDLTPKQVKPNGATIEAKITKVDLPGAPPQAAPMLASMNGLVGVFDVSRKGEVGEVQFTATPQMKNQLAENVVQGLSQAVQLLLAPFPDAPIGVGAKWEVAARADQPDQGAKRFTLKELTADGGVVETEIDIKVPRRAAQGPRGGTMFVEADGKGKYTYQVKFDRMAPRVDGELVINERIEIPAGAAGGQGAPPGQPGGGGKQQVAQSQKVKHTIESAK